MLGPVKVRRVDQPVVASLGALVPADHFYRHLDRTLDLSFVRDLVQDAYAAGGRPSIDPVVFFKLQLILFFEGIRSERQLVETASLNLAHRWYLGYALNEELPDHSSLTRMRERYGLAVFRRFFEAIVEQCIAAGLVWGEELFLDATKVAANAALDSLQPRFAVEAHLGDQDHDVVDGGRARIILTALVAPAEGQEYQPALDLLWWSRFRWKLWPRQVVGDTKDGSVEHIAAIEREGICASFPLSAVG